LTLDAYHRLVVNTQLLKSTINPTLRQLLDVDKYREIALRTASSNGSKTPPKAVFEPI
jgi:hypothetical protein